MIFLLERTNKCLINIKGGLPPPPLFLYNTILCAEMLYFIVALGEREFSWPVFSLCLEWLGLFKWQTRAQCNEIKILIFNKLGLRTMDFFFFRACCHASLTRFNEIIAHFEIGSNLLLTLSNFTFHDYFSASPALLSLISYRLTAIHLPPRVVGGVMQSSKATEGDRQRRQRRNGTHDDERRWPRDWQARSSASRRQSRREADDVSFPSPYWVIRLI